MIYAGKIVANELAECSSYRREQKVTWRKRLFCCLSAERQMPASKVEPMSILRPLCFCLGPFARILPVAKKRRREQKSISHNARVYRRFMHRRVGLGRVSLATCFQASERSYRTFLSNVVQIAAYVTSTSG